MAMKVMNKKDVIERNYLQHTILEKDIMALVSHNIINIMKKLIPITLLK